MLFAGRMSDHCAAVRVMSTRCFASLIQLMPLDGAIPEPAGLSQQLKERRLRDKAFLEQLFNPKLIKDYKIPVQINAELRSYQQVICSDLFCQTQVFCKIKPQLIKQED